MIVSRWWLSTCLDVDECQSNPCHVNAKCANTIGSSLCECNAGYLGDGKTCNGNIIYLYLKQN